MIFIGTSLVAQTRAVEPTNTAKLAENVHVGTGPQTYTVPCMAATPDAAGATTPRANDRRNADVVIRSLGVLARAQELGDADHVLERLTAEVHSAMGDVTAPR